MQKVFLVTGFDVGGNSGATIERVFANEADAEFFAEHSIHRTHNNAFEGALRGAPFDVEEYEVVASLDDIADDWRP